MDITDQVFRIRLFVGNVFGVFGSRGKRSFVMETVEIAATLDEFFYPFLRLWEMNSD